MKTFNIIYGILFIAWLMHHFYLDKDPLAFIVIITAFLSVYFMGRRAGMEIVHQKFKVFATERLAFIREEMDKMSSYKKEFWNNENKMNDE